MIEFLTYGFIQKALLGGIAIALLCGLIGPFLVLRRLSLLGDGLAHLAFGGVALGLLLGINPLFAAFITVIIGSFWIHSLVKKNVYGDAAIALVLSLGVGMGIIIIGLVKGFNVNLFSYLIGSILSLNTVDIVLAITLLVLTIAFFLFSYRDLFFMTFNEELAILHNKNLEKINIIFTILTAMIIVLSIRAVGILLVSALIVIPTLLALNISKSFKQTLFFSALFSALAMILGIILSFIFDIPPSGSIVLLLFLGFLITQFFRRK